MVLRDFDDSFSPTTDTNEDDDDELKDKPTNNAHNNLKILFDKMKAEINDDVGQNINDGMTYKIIVEMIDDIVT